MLFMRYKTEMPKPAEALPGRTQAPDWQARHRVTGHSLKGPFPAGLEQAFFALGCFWGAERRFWQAPGVYVTAVGYMGGYTPHATYEEICSGRTGHAEAVLVVYDPARTSYAALLKIFWESHDPTQGMRQGNDIGTQYRSAIFTLDATQTRAAALSRARYQQVLTASGHGIITTEIAPADIFYYAEEYHQQYLAKNPDGYCGLGGTGIACPIGANRSHASGMRA